MKLTTSIETNLKIIRKTFHNTSDIIVKKFSILTQKACVVHLKGIVDTKTLSEFVLVPSLQVKKLPKENVFEFVQENCVLVSDVEEQEYALKVCELIAKGKACLLLEGYEKCIIINIDKAEERAITEPPTSAVLKGPRQGFNENIKTNMSCLRKIVASPQLKSVKIMVGKQTKTQVNVVFLNNVASKEVVNKIISKIKLINIDGVIDSYYIVQYLEERPKSIFKQVGIAEKPDIVASKLLEGRVAILVDGSPIIITLPFILLEDIHSADDYYQQQFRVVSIRLLRVISIALTILLPGLYIALQMFHYRAMPLRFLVTILNSTQGLPFTPFAEMLVVIILFEILYEASLRMPKYLGLALSVVGALILGDTAVKAGLISPPAVMIVAVSGITIYTIPDEAAQLSLLRIFFVLAGGLLGFYGLMLVAMVLVIYLADFDNYGAPYLAPFTPRIKCDKQDSIFKSEVLNMKSRPTSIPNNNSKRSR